MPHRKNLFNTCMITVIIVTIAALYILAVLASTASGASEIITERNDQISQRDSVLIKHEAYLIENSVKFDDGMDAIAYEHSQKAKEAAYANAKLAEMNANAARSAK